MYKNSLLSHFSKWTYIIVLPLCFACRTDNLSMAAPHKAIHLPFPKGYKGLYKAISIRNANKILTYTKSNDLLVRNQAWRAMYVTPINTDKLFNVVTASGDPLAWFALSGHHLHKSQLRDLEKLWSSRPKFRTGISLVLGKQGDQKSLHFLYAHLNDTQHKKEEYDTILAIGRLMLKFPLSQKQYQSMLHAALTMGQPTLQQAYLYAFYRSKKNWLTNTLVQNITKAWKVKSTHWSRLTRQMLVHIMAKDSTKQLWHLIQPNTIKGMDVNMSIELAKSLRYYPFDKQTTPYYVKLLDYPNSRVKDQTMQVLTEKKWSDSLMADRLSQIMDHTKKTNPRLYLDALNLVSRFQPDILKKNTPYLKYSIQHFPYLSELAMRLLRKTMNRTDYIKYLMQQTLNDDVRIAESAVTSLRNEWNRLPDHEKSIWVNPFNVAVDQVLRRDDRGLTATVAPLLSDSLIFSKGDIPTLVKTMQHFKLPGDIEAYEAIAPFLWKHMGKNGKKILNSWAEKRYPPLNRYLKKMGMRHVPAGNYHKYPLAQPNWQRLDNIGGNPKWTLITNKGNIKISLDALRCPATVSAIDSLTHHHSYNNVPFHRVVNNFVIQGGDFERKDGYGGANFTLPTEPSEENFVRGSVGIASAGTDTEGPQFFIMHQWSPHLNGHYTLFGHVVYGMKTVDKILQGDRVENAYMGSE